MVLFVERQDIFFSASSNYPDSLCDSCFILISLHLITFIFDEEETVRVVGIYEQTFRLELRISCIISSQSLSVCNCLV